MYCSKSHNFPLKAILSNFRTQKKKRICLLETKDGERKEVIGDGTMAGVSPQGQ